jgi:hypothetical protein
LRLARLCCEHESVCVVDARLISRLTDSDGRRTDSLHRADVRDWCDVAIYEDGAVRSAGRVSTEPEQLQLFAQSLGPDDRVGLETTGNALEHRGSSSRTSPVSWSPTRATCAR